MVSALNDGMFDLLPADSVRDTWFEQGEGRIVMDLQKEMLIDSIHLFSVLTLKRGPQFFSLWGLPDKKPVITGDPKANGWEYIVSATPLDVEGSGNAVSSIVTEREKAERYRYLMWVSENSAYGPYYFREVDIFESQ
jgi:hypothetical protein